MDAALLFRAHLAVGSVPLRYHSFVYHYLLTNIAMKRIVFLLLAFIYLSSAWACTSFIISGKATPSGKPMMFKHRDTGELNNRIAYFQGEKYAFIGLMNSPMLDGEVWSGMNEAGFCIMNTASYNLREDSLKCQMDREGELMHHALANCATLADFEAWLETYPQPWGVEANFGIIDAQGGAAYYEMNNHRWIKYDVNAETDGYRVVTNFSFAGRYEDYEGWERYQTASAIMKESFSRDKEMTATDAINLFSRQYRHELLGLHYTSDNAPQYVVDQDFIPRRSTSAVVVFDGVAAQRDPRHTLMWTLLGYPACAVAIPLVLHPDYLPPYMQARDTLSTSGKGLHSELCDLALGIKHQWVFPLHISNGHRYIALQNILCDRPNAPSLLSCTHRVEQSILTTFEPFYAAWCRGEISDEEFYQQYQQGVSVWFEQYKESFASYIP